MSYVPGQASLGDEQPEYYEEPEYRPQDRRGLRPPRRRRRGRGWLIFLSILLALVLIVAAVVGGFVFNLTKTFDEKRQAIPNSEVFPQGQRPQKAAGDKSVNFLLLGSDTRATAENGQDAADGRSDTIMFVHVPGDRHNVTVTSIMRDTWVEIPGHGSGKINGAFSLGGTPLAVQTIENMLDTRIDHVATIDFQGFKDLVEALGGVDVTVPKPFDKAGTHFEGTMHLNGTQALWFARERHAFKDGDYQRVKDQQILMKAIISKTLSPSTVSSPSKVNAVVENFSPYIGVDQDLTGGVMARLGLGLALHGVRGNDVHFFTLPNAGTGWSPDGRQSIVKPDPAVIDEMRQALRDDSMDQFMDKHHLG